MITITASQLDYYQKKIQKQELDIIILEQELAKITCIAPLYEDYKIKYQMLLAKCSKDQSLRVSRNVNQIKDKEMQINSINEKWQIILAQSKSEKESLIKENQKMNTEILKLQNQIGDHELAYIKIKKEFEQESDSLQKIKLDSLKQENEKIKSESETRMIELIDEIQDLKVMYEEKIVSAKQRQKSFYRDQIIKLQEKIEELQILIEEEKVKTDPKRQKEIQKLQQTVIDHRTEQAEEIVKINDILAGKNKIIDSLAEQLKRVEKSSLQQDQETNIYVKNLEEKLFKIQREHQIQMINVRNQLSTARQQQVADINKRLQGIEQDYQKERQNWNTIIKEAEVDNNLIKQKMEQEKNKYIEEKKRLKQKILDLKKRLNAKIEEGTETQNLINSLKDVENHQSQFNNYQNGITFLDHQIRKASVKIEEKNREVASLLEQMNQIQEDYEKEIKIIKQKNKRQVNILCNQINDLEKDLQNAMDQIRQKDKYLRKKQNDFSQQKVDLQTTVINLKNIIQEMQKDFKRVTNNKKNLEDSFRQQRQNVVTGKIDVNQERKKKWTEMGRQRNELQIIYKQRQAKLKAEFESTIEKLKRDKQLLGEDNKQLIGEVEVLKQNTNVPKKSKQDRIAEYEAKMTTLDLEMSMAQNLFSNLSSAIARQSAKKKTQLDEISEKHSEQLGNSMEEECASPMFKMNAYTPIEESNAQFLKPNKFQLFSFHPQKYKK